MIKVKGAVVMVVNLLVDRGSNIFTQSAGFDSSQLPGRSSERQS